MGSAGKLHSRVMEDVLKRVRSSWLEEGVEAEVADRLRARWNERMEARNEVRSEGAVSNAALALTQAVGGEAPSLPANAPRPVEGGTEPAGKRVKLEGEKKESGEESLSSLSDDSSVMEEMADCPNLVLCQFETVKKTKNTWKVKLLRGLVITETQDYRFGVAHAVLTRW